MSTSNGNSSPEGDALGALDSGIQQSNTTETTPAEEESSSEVIYLEDKPLRKLFRQMLLTACGAVLILATMGFIMGLMGAKTPHVSNGVVWNQFSQLTGQDTGTDDWNELEKNP